MNKIIKNLMLIITLVACGLSETLTAIHGGGGGRGGGGRGGGVRRSGTGGARRTTGTRRAGGTKRTGGMKKSGKTMRGKKSSGRRPGGKGRGGKGQHHYRGHHHPGGYWRHGYGWNSGLYPWGWWLLATTPLWWTTWNWGTYYASNPAMQDEIEALQAQLNANVAEMRAKDERLVDLEKRLDAAEDANTQAELSTEISTLKSQLRSQANKTKRLESQLKTTAGISDADIPAQED